MPAPRVKKLFSTYTADCTPTPIAYAKSSPASRYQLL